MSAFVALVVGVCVHRPANKAPWLLFAAGMLCWTGGDAYWNSYEWFLGRGAPYPSPADIMYLTAYPLLAAGVLSLMRGWGRPRLRDLLDGAIITASASVIVWVVLIGPLARGSSVGTFAKADAALTTLGDVVLLTLLVQVVWRHRGRNLALRAIVAALSLTLASDYVYAYLNLKSAYTSGMSIDAGWLLFYILFGVAALHPSMRSIDALDAESHPRLSSARIGALTAALLVPPVTLIAQVIFSTLRDALEVGVGEMLIVVLVGLRMWLLAREREQAQRELRDQAAELRAMVEELETARSTKDEFLAMVSHELRSPLTSIRGYVELLAEEELTPDQHRFVEVVGRGTSRLLLLINDLLLMTQIQSGKLPLHIAEVDLDQVVLISVAAAKPSAERKRIELNLRTDPGLETRGDAERLAQSVDNLISNAIKYTPDGGSVTVALTHSGETATIAVSDTGIGIPAHEQAQMFDRFFRSTNAQVAGIQGTGLGLAITRGIVAAHGGTIGFDSTEGAGTTFRITLPHAHTASGLEWAA